MLKSPASTIFFRFWKYIFKMSFTLFHITVRWLVVLRIIFLDLVLDVSIERDWITSQYILRSSLSLKLRFNAQKDQLLFPYDFVLFDVGPGNLKVENSNFCWKTCRLPMFLKKQTMLNLIIQALIFTCKTEKESFNKHWNCSKVKIIRATVMCLKRRNILVKATVSVMLTIYWAFVNAKRIMRQRFGINIWSHFAYTLYLKKPLSA